MTRNINYFRQKHRPQELKQQEKDFDLNYTHFPSDFLLEDILPDGERHILFATTTQLRLLPSAKLGLRTELLKECARPTSNQFQFMRLCVQAAKQ